MTTSQSFITSNEQQRYDSAMAPCDCQASMAHVVMLADVGIVSDHDAALILSALREIQEQAARGEFPYDPSKGAQLTLEQLVIDRVGAEIGHRLHTGRSRNDQVMVTQKLYVREHILDYFGKQLEFVALLVAKAGETIDVIKPGYTHMQPARPTTFGQWYACYADMLLVDLHRIMDTYQRHNGSPLGAAESYGTSWPLDRALTAELLGFERVDENPTATISSRGRSDADFLSALAFAALDLSCMAQDLLLMNTFEYEMVELGEGAAQRMGILTGSSIMPQKKNPDVLELVRATVSQIYAELFQCLELMKALPSGYNRDARDTKGPIIEGIEKMSNAMTQMTGVVDGLILKTDRMLQLVKDNYSMATDLAEYLAQKYSIPQRSMHAIVGGAVKEAISAGTKLYDIKPSVFSQCAEKQGVVLPVTQGDLDGALDPHQAIERRASVGGSARSRMEEWVTSRTGQCDDAAKWFHGEKQRIASANEKLAQRSALLTSTFAHPDKAQSGTVNNVTP